MAELPKGEVQRQGALINNRFSHIAAVNLRANTCGKETLSIRKEVSVLFMNMLLKVFQRAGTVTVTTMCAEPRTPRGGGPESRRSHSDRGLRVIGWFD